MHKQFDAQRERERLRSAGFFYAPLTRYLLPLFWPLCAIVGPRITTVSVVFEETFPFLSDMPTWKSDG